MIRALLLSVVRAAEITYEREGVSVPSPELTAGLILRSFGTRLAVVHAKRVVELLEAARDEQPIRLVK
jgi:hypothetical protein